MAENERIPIYIERCCGDCYTEVVIEVYPENIDRQLLIDIQTLNDDFEKIHRTCPSDAADEGAGGPQGAPT